MDWEDKETVKKGNIGERLVNDYLHKIGLIVYEPITDGAHAFDKLVAKGKERLIIAEVKTKAKRSYYPDTGINYRHYLEYKKISENHNLPVWLFFVDEVLGEIYGGKLSDLEQPNSYELNGKNYSYPVVNGSDNDKIIYFYQPSMKSVCKLTPEQIEEIKAHSTRNYEY